MAHGRRRVWRCNGRTIQCHADSQLGAARMADHNHGDGSSRMGNPNLPNPFRPPLPRGVSSADRDPGLTRTSITILDVQPEPKGWRLLKKTSLLNDVFLSLIFNCKLKAMFAVNNFIWLENRRKDAAAKTS